MSMKNYNCTIGNRTRELPVCSAVPQPTAPPAACHNVRVNIELADLNISHSGKPGGSVLPGSDVIL
jgi:hypothetical protein